MSFKSWCDEHYPVTAREISRKYHADEVPMTDVIQHSIDKWKGLRGINIRKHEVYAAVHETNGCIEVFDTDSNILGFHGHTCSLCAVSGRDCNDCPIYINLGKTCHEAYGFVDPGIPSTIEDMVTLLEETLKAETVFQNKKD